MVWTRSQTAFIARGTFRFLDLPPEITARIINNLDLKSIQSFRLASRQFASRCLTPHFLGHFAHQKLNLLLEETTRLAEKSTGSAIVSVAIKHVTIDATRFSFLDSEQYDDELVDSMATAFRAISSLDRIEIGGPQEKLGGRAKGTAMKRGAKIPRMSEPVTHRAAAGFTLVMSAIAKSGVAIKELVVFRAPAWCRGMLQSIVFAELLPTLNAKNSRFSDAAGAIKKFSTSLATRRNLLEVRHGLMGRRERDDHCLPATSSLATAKENFFGLAGMLHHMPNLKTLDIHFYDTLIGTTDAYSEIFDFIADSLTLPYLENLSLDMLPVKERSLLKFLKKSPMLQKASFKWVRLTEGTWKPIFRYLSDEAPHLSKIHLASIADSKTSMVNLCPSRGSKSSKSELHDLLGKETEAGNGYVCSEGTMIHRREFREGQIRGELVFEDERVGSPLDSTEWQKYTAVLKAKSDRNWEKLETEYGY
ncbi:hypothetical protein CkaCkLH20_00697 [Colletotrichum karsti]|uniref:F-box domain-containing protein n=1 Tax=Colletotrichum karsti TaxID=1095194 RepID=A0A9P6LQD6_9PEZI|nr:uncharacterized protein CkaCkLH20_00697 [Colletotrichum karsti]KAF9881551.1 hypothetical protein CkaCkLH20_00697 [Colletotrichum karsti]